ncbi:MAG: hypothetical protein K6T75_00950 [Acetobacteraceae bacterium]|nr:hypothetical protein [Acetobacteraceae bacterium]
MPEEFTLQTLGTQAGAAAAVGLVVQLTKPALKRFPHWIIRLYVLAWSWVVVFLALAASGGLTCQTALVAFFNGLLVAVMALGGYEVASDPACRKHHRPPGEEPGTGA